MRHPITSVLFAGLAVLVSGCGTVSNLRLVGKPDSPKVYGGVRHDLEMGTTLMGEWADRSGSCIPPAFNLAGGSYLLLVDLPLSLAGDTITLPLVLWTDLEHRNAAARTTAGTRPPARPALYNEVSPE